MLDEVLGGALAPTEDACLLAVADGPVVDELPTTDSLMQVIKERLRNCSGPLQHKAIRPFELRVGRLHFAYDRMPLSKVLPAGSVIVR